MKNRSSARFSFGGEDEDTQTVSNHHFGPGGGQSVRKGGETRLRGYCLAGRDAKLGSSPITWQDNVPQRGSNNSKRVVMNYYCIGPTYQLDRAGGFDPVHVLKIDFHPGPGCS